MPRRLTTAALVAAVIALPGCAAQPPGVTPIPTETNAESATPTPTPEPSTAECLATPPDVAASGLRVVGCILDLAPNQQGGETFHAAVDDASAFDTAKAALESIGMDITVCSQEPRRCGFTTYGAGGDASLLLIPAGGDYSQPVLEYFTWNF